ncbi:hypothetical protein C0993_008141 [Termitomyces sp. T159_Od127]|nr:hypothetical protein C0993_008141 [Termitomyces sp. T159_Od127]
MASSGSKALKLITFKKETLSQPATDLWDLGPALGPQPPPNPSPQLFWAWTTTRPTTLATPSHHRPSPPLATTTTGISLAITAMTATSALAPAITLPVTATLALAPAIPSTSPTTAATSAPALPWPVPRPPSCITITHHHRPDLHTPYPASAHLLTTSLLHVSVLPKQDLLRCTTCLNLHHCLAQSLSPP